MIQIEQVEIAGLNPAMRGMRNPMNSWDRSDSRFCGVICPNEDGCMGCPMWFGPDDEGAGQMKTGCQMAPRAKSARWEEYIIGPKDHALATKLSAGGSVHAKYRRMIVVWADITAPLYWWKEFDTYKVGTVANSCSTMHKIHEKEFVMEDFSAEHLYGAPSDGGTGGRLYPKDVLDLTIRTLNACREQYMNVHNSLRQEQTADQRARLVKKHEELWWQMIQLLPSSYNQKRTVMFSYEMLANATFWRTEHKLDEWRDFCQWARTLPYSELFTVPRDEKDISSKA